MVKGSGSLSFAVNAPKAGMAGTTQSSPGVSIPVSSTSPPVEEPPVPAPPPPAASEPPVLDPPVPEPGPPVPLPLVPLVDDVSLLDEVPPAGLPVLVLVVSSVSSLLETHATSRGRRAVAVSLEHFGRKDMVGLAESKGLGMVVVEQVVLRFLRSETPRSATGCTFPVEGVSIRFLVVPIAVLTMLALNALHLEDATSPAGMTRRLRRLR